MGLKEDIELSLERLRVEKEIAQQVERQTKSVGSYVQSQKEVRKNAKEIKRLEETINTINDEINKKKAQGITLTKKEQELADQTLAKLQQQRDQLVATNKELLSAGSAIKSIGNSMITAVKSLVPSLSSVISTVLSLDDKLRDTAATIGLSGAGFDAMKASTEELRDVGVEWGFGLNYGVQSMASFNQQTGRAVILSKEVGEQMAITARAVGMTAEEFGGLAGSMEAFGLGAGQSAKMVSDIQAMSENMGVNSGKVIKKFEQNLKMLNKLNFRGGMNAMAKMAAHSEKFKLSMEAVASVSDKVFRPEGAIEAAAQLQVMGGAMAQLGDPFQLMYQARNAPEELAKSITKAARESAVFNKQTGQFEMSAHELDRLRESATALGMDYSELVETAKQAAKIDYFEQYLGGMSDEEKGLISGMATMGEKGAEITFLDPQGKLQTKLLGELSKTEKENIVKRAKSDKERADQAMSVAKNWQAIQDALMLVAVEILQPFVNFLNEDFGKSWINKIKQTIIDFAGSVREFMKGGGLSKYKDELILGLKIGIASFIALWVGSQIFAGMKFGLGFKMTSGIGKVGGAGGAGGAGMSGAGMSGAGSMMKSLGGAAQVLAIAGAMYILAEALIKFNDVEWESMAKGGVAMIGFGIALKLLEPVLNSFGKSALFGVVAMLGLGAAIMMLGVGLMFMAQVPLDHLIVSFLGIIGVLVAFSALSLSGIGWAGVALVLAVGAAFLMLGAAIYIISAGISMIIDSFTNMFSIINADNIGAIMMLGPALMLASLGVMSLAASMVVMGLALANPFGLLGLLGLVTAASALKEAFGGVDSGGITEAVNSVNSVNKENIDALKSLSAWLAFAGSNIKIEFGEIHVDGQIGLAGSGGVTADSELLKDPIFMRELKRVIAEHTHFDKKGGR